MSVQNGKIWNSGLEYVLQSAFEAGVGADNIKLCLTVSGIDADGQAIRLVADLAKNGSRVTRQGDVITVEVSDGQASEFLRAQSEGVQS